MTSPKGDPTYIKNKDRYFMQVAEAVAKASTHPTAPGGCIIVRGREIIGDGRSLLTDSKVEVDCLTYAIAASSKAGTNTVGSIIYTTRYPFSSSVFQAHLMGLTRIFVLSHEWETYYKDEFRKAARLAREVSISIEPIFFNEDPRFTTNSYDRNIDEELYPDQNPFETDEYDPTDSAITHDEDTATI